MMSCIYPDEPCEWREGENCKNDLDWSGCHNKWCRSQS